MNVCLVLNTYWDASRPGVGRKFPLLVTALRGLGHNVHVIAPFQLSDRSPAGLGGLLSPNPEILIEEGGVVVRALEWSNLAQRRYSGWPPLAQLRSRTARRCWEALESVVGTVDVVHSHGVLDAGHEVLHLGLQRGRAWVHTEHHSHLQAGRVPFEYRRRYVHVLRNAHAVTAVGAPLADRLRQFAQLPHTPATVPNPLDSVFFSQPEPAHYSIFESVSGARQIEVVHIGRLAPIKRQDVLLRAFALARSQSLPKGHDLRLTIVGVGEEARRLKSLAQSLGVNEYVDWRGEVASDQVRRILDRAAVYVQTSDSETFGLPVFEAQARGLPVVVTECGGPEAHLTAGDGLVVPRGCPRAVASAICTLAAEDSEASRASRRQRAANRFGPEAVANEYLQIYREASRRARSG